MWALSSGHLLRPRGQLLYSMQYKNTLRLWVTEKFSCAHFINNGDHFAYNIPHVMCLSFLSRDSWRVFDMQKQTPMLRERLHPDLQHLRWGQQGKWRFLALLTTFILLLHKCVNKKYNIMKTFRIKFYNVVLWTKYVANYDLNKSLSDSGHI